VRKALGPEYKPPHVRQDVAMETLRQQRDELASLTAMGRTSPVKPPPVHTLSPKVVTRTVTRRFKKFTHSGAYVRRRLCACVARLFFRYCCCRCCW
jgi:hypothetical protein